MSTDTQAAITARAQALAQMYDSPHAPHDSFDLLSSADQRAATVTEEAEQYGDATSGVATWFLVRLVNGSGVTLVEATADTEELAAEAARRALGESVEDAIEEARFAEADAEHERQVFESQYRFFVG